MRASHHRTLPKRRNRRIGSRSFRPSRPKAISTIPDESRRARRLIMRTILPAGRLLLASHSVPTRTWRPAKLSRWAPRRNGKSAEVKIEDRGPYVNGRIVDVAPAVANKLDMQKSGVTPVEVAPVAVPQRDGPPKLGAGAADAQDVEQAVRETEASKR